MNKTEAFAAMRKLWGSKAGYRIHKDALVGDVREAARAELPALQEAEKAAVAARDAKKAELLQDPEYLRLCQDAKEALKARQNLSGKIHTRRVTVGISDSIFFHVKGEGDNWAEAIRNAKKEGK